MYVKCSDIGLVDLPNELKIQGFSLYPVLPQIMVVANSHAFWNSGDKETRNTKSVKSKLRTLCPTALMLCMLVVRREFAPDHHFLLFSHGA